jgi:hypothetical protein
MRGVLETDFFINALFDVAEIDLGTLQGVVHLLRDAEEVGATLDHAPTRAHPTLGVCRSVSSDRMLGWRIYADTPDRMEPKLKALPASHTTSCKKRSQPSSDARDQAVARPA